MDGDDIYNEIVNMFKSEDDGGKGKSYDDIKNKELFGSLNKGDSETETETETVTKPIENKVDSIIPIKSTKSIDNFQEIIVKIEKKKSIIFFNILNFLSSGKENEKFRGDGENIFFLTEGPQMQTTIDGDKCQYWNSHEIHQEGSFLNIFKSIFKYPKNGKIWSWMDDSERKLIGDGLLIARGGTFNASNGVITKDAIDSDLSKGRIDVTGSVSEEISKKDAENIETIKESGKTAVTQSSVKWAPHNFCRNPGNFMPSHLGVTQKILM